MTDLLAMTAPAPPVISPRVAVVGGGARGIGAAVCRRLLASGHHVIIFDRPGAVHGGYPLASHEDINALLAEAEEGQVSAIDVDLRNRLAVRRALARAAETQGRIDAVVACASIIAGGPRAWQTDDSMLDELWHSVVITTWNLAVESIPHLLRRPSADHPTFVALSSTAGRTGIPGLTAYCMAKHAVEGLVRGLAADLVATGVTACGVAPGATNSTMLHETARAYGLADVGPLVEGSAVRRALDPDEVAAVVELAARAGPVVHGAVLRADGGFPRG